MLLDNRSLHHTAEITHDTTFDASHCMQCFMDKFACVRAGAVVSLGFISSNLFWQIWDYEFFVSIISLRGEACDA